MMESIINKLRIFEFLMKEFDNPYNILYKYALGKSYELKKEGEIILTSKRGSGTLDNIYNRFYRKGFELKPYKDQVFCLDNGDYKLLGMNAEAVNEDFETYCSFDLEGEVVFDIGGYLGETAVRFIKETNCRSVHVFEPVPENYEIIEDVISINNLENEITPYKKAISNESCKIQLSSDKPPMDVGFGLEEGKHTIEVDSLSWTDIIDKAVSKESNYIKSDCEGGEKYLKDVKDSDLQKISKWVIETHTAEIRDSIERKFEKAGFNVQTVEIKSDNHDLALVKAIFE